MTKLTAGSPAPALALPNQDGTLVNLNDLLGSTVVVYFYPKAFTPGCTTQACDFRDNLSALKAAGVVVLGISADEPAKLREFTDTYQLNFSLLSDADSVAAKSWGAWGTKQVNGQEMVGALRSTVIVDPNGTVQAVDYNVPADGSVTRVLEQLGL